MSTRSRCVTGLDECYQKDTSFISREICRFEVDVEQAQRDGLEFLAELETLEAARRVA